MLDVAIGFLAQQLNAHRAARSGVGRAASASFPTWAVATRLVNDKGDSAVPKGGVGFALVNVEEERAAPAQIPEARRVGDRHVMFEPELKLNLSLLFAASDDPSYAHALQSLSTVLTFFQAHSLFTPERNPDLDARVTRLAVSLVTPTYEQLNQLWSFVGGKQLPSALYRVRLVALQDEEPVGVGEPILRIDQAVGMR
jgi:hypothetical protein